MHDSANEGETMKQSAKDHGRIEEHTTGTGPPTPESVERRAREIAVIESRSPDSVNDEDRRRALAELRGRLSSGLPPEEGDELLATRNPTDLAVDTGHPAGVQVTPADEPVNAQKMVEEGIREAEHDRMLRAHKEEERPS